MKVYLIHAEDGDQYEQFVQICGIVTSEEKAEEEIKRLDKEHPLTDGYGESIYFYREYELDKVDEPHSL